jgi:hypothetical protein
MSEDSLTLSCRYCGVTVRTADAHDIETPVGPVSLCQHCLPVQRWTDYYQAGGSDA